MPIYEYRCEGCGHEFEKLVRMNAADPECPSCEGSEVRKLISAAGFILKGSGWYRDHYGLKKSSSRGSDGASSESSSASAGGADGGSSSSSSTSDTSSKPTPASSGSDA